MDYIVTFITTPSEDEAEKIAKILVEERLAGCVNIIKGIRSIYFWQGKIEDEPEVLMVIKTKSELFDELAQRVKSIHSYTIPEIIAIKINKGSENYLNWLGEITK